MESLTRKSLKHKTALAVISSCILMNISCQKQEVYSHFYEIKDAAWNQSDTLIFDIDSTLIEVNKPYTLSIEVSNNVNYPYQNIWFFVQDNIQSDSAYVQQSKEYQLADEYGKWLGSGFGSIYQISLPLYDTLSFDQKRSYRIKLLHAMRDKALQGIEKVGLRLNIKTD